MNEVKWLSAARVWKNAFMIGFGVARDADDGCICILIQLGRWLVVIGPHVPVNDLYK